MFRMKREVLCVFFIIAIYHSVLAVLASDGMAGHGVITPTEDSSSSGNCCASLHSKVHQSSQVFANKGRQFTRQIMENEVQSNSIESSPSTEFIASMTCPTWFTPNDNTSCECGSSLGGLVDCDGRSKNVSLFKGYCMTFNVNGSMLVVGPCLYGECFLANDFHSYRPLPSNTSKLNELCSRYHRDGQLCGRCEDGFALPVYSYNQSCVKCENDYGSNWLKYLAASLLPLTLFLIMIVMFRVRVTSGLMNAFVLLSQAMSLPALLRGVMLNAECLSDGGSRIVFLIYSVIFGIWNLDFFRLLYPPFCLHPETTTVQVLALDYVIAVYPLFLLVIAYLLVTLHDSGVKLIVWMWRPFHRCFVHFRRNWNIKTSLIDAFATFLLLSYTKFLSVSFDLLIPMYLFNIRDKHLNKLYLFWSGTTEYFGSEHLPYAILALAVVIVFNILPFLLLCLYPSRWFQKCLNRCRLQNQILYTFMDAFLGCYKDGTNGSCDCRWFAGLYLFIRILYIIILSVIWFNFSAPLLGCAVLVLLLLTAVLQPYKSSTHNRVNVFFLSVILFIITLYMGFVIASTEAVQYIHLSKLIFGLSISIPVIYITGVILYELFGHWMCVQRMYQRLCRVCMKVEDDEYERLLPERMVNVEECAVLLADSMQVGRSKKEIHVSTK